jgi:hypothetical protein
MTALSDIEERQVRWAERRRLVAYLSRCAHNPRRIGIRVLLLNYLYTNGDDRQKQSELAAVLRVSKSRVSTALSQLRADVEQQ